MREFKVGDKVKIPKTKSKFCDITSSGIVNRVLKTSQDHLYIKRIDYDGTYVLVSNLNHPGGDYFLEQDLELYEGNYTHPNLRKLAKEEIRTVMDGKDWYISDEDARRLIETGKYAHFADFGKDKNLIIKLPGHDIGF